MSHVAYLEAKRPLDDRSLNRDVLDRFREELPTEPTVLEVGAGTATMVERLHEWGIIEDGTWVCVDTHEPAVRAGASRLAAREDATETYDGGVGLGDEVAGGRDDHAVATLRLDDCRVELNVADAFEFVESTPRSFDAVVGCAFLDIVDPEPAVAAFGSVAPLLYAPITYDGETTFRPPDADDAAVLDQYHHHMRECRAGGPEGATALTKHVEVLSAGPSPWRIDPPYAEGERRVLAHILDTVETAVEETGDDASAWAERRRAALDSGDLAYEARNRDLLARL